MTTIWEPLDVSKAEIRLLTLYPSNKLTDRPECSLRIVSLNDRPYFEALSYVWGNPDVKVPIRLNQQQWFVTPNLESALRYLRHKDESVDLWVDAICINQQDLEERSNQVQLMEQIYTQASGVRAWLGESEFGVEEAFELLQQVRQKKEAKKMTVKGASLNASHIEKATGLAQRAWWNRVWVQQEASLNEKVTIHCGSISTDLNDIAHIADFDVDRQVHDIEGLSDTWRKFRETSQKNLMYGRVKRCESASSFLYNLASGLSLDASDSHDYIYGFLALAPSELRKVIKPDYGQSSEQTFIDLVLAVSSVTRNLQVLDFSGIDLQRDPDLPTWAPDWRKVTDQIPPLHEEDCGTPPIWLLASNGVSMDYVGRYHDSEMECRRVTPEDWLIYRDCTKMVKNITHGSNYDFTTSEDDLLAFRLDVNSGSVGRKLFRTDKDYIGAGPMEAREGDCVYILAGGSVPYILRPVESATRLGSFRYVGTSYVHGIMDGEAVIGADDASTTSRHGWSQVFLE
ncbi:uncharacterized protein KY384_008828 [Bacidia gigantensis]|uniref:uncharacterized protein n=1 Tax=Bacidia gigantensis TaxID=2732470 RepID=UPI001D056EE0|nr:uncharacterized protein KY384_008828 [Bacidia gigantensis]KAG8526627.1 hypothetical protein KY384_008828 [Bacidia gigantensis]